MRQLALSSGKVLDRLETLLFIVAVLALAAIAVIMITAITLRQIGSSIPDDIIVVQQLMLVSIACALGYVTAQRAHIEVDILYQRVGPRARTILSVNAVLIGLLAILPIAIWGAVDFFAAYTTGRFYYGRLQIPEWPARLVFAIGLAVVALRLIQQGLLGLLGILPDSSEQGHF